MAGIQANGIGSGLDISSLVTQLVNAEAAPITQRITRAEIAITTKISALGTLKGALATFKSALDPLKSESFFKARQATAAKTDFFTVSADTSAATGQYDVEVVNLASSHQLASAPFLTGSTTAIGSGTLTISAGAVDFDVEITPAKNTLSDVRDAINLAGSARGIQATLLNTVDGTRLVLTTSQSGAVGAIEVAASGGDGGLNQLIYQPGVTENLTELQPAKDALIRVANFDIKSATNTFDDAIDGVTITVKKVSAGEKVSVGVAFDNGAVLSRIQKFVTEYNNAQAQITKLGAYNAETKVAGALLGDSLLRAVDDELRRGISNPVSDSGSYTTLASIGITTGVTGALQLDATKLTKALETDAASIARLFGSESGIAARLYTKLEKRLASSGDIETRNTRLNTDLKGISRDKEAANLRIAQIESRYRKQFTALDGLLSRMQSTASYLTQQLSNMSR